MKLIVDLGIRVGPIATIMSIIRAIEVKFFFDKEANIGRVLEIIYNYVEYYFTKM